MLGHSTLKQTSDYVNVKQDDVAETMRKYDQPPPACKADANPTSADPRPLGNASAPSTRNDRVH